MCSRHVRFNEKLMYKDEFKNNKNFQNDLEYLENADSLLFEIDYSDIETEIERESEANTNIENVNENKNKRGRPKKRTLQNEKQKESSPVRKQPKRSAKVDKEFMIYAMETDFENLIEDTSFAYFTTSSIDKSKVIFDVDDSNEVTHNLEQDEIRFSLLATINKDPSSYKEALLSPNSADWLKAIDEEKNSITENKVWKLIDRPLDKKEEKKLNIIDSRWVFTRKTGEDGKMKFKARLVIRGFKDLRCYELKETYVPVSRLPLIRAILAIVNKYNLELYQMDVKNAFLNGILDEDIYMEIPDGFEENSEIRKTKICKLQKALYGLKISPKK